jgi:predicted small secreted protein
LQPTSETARDRLNASGPASNLAHRFFIVIAGPTSGPVLDQPHTEIIMKRLSLLIAFLAAGMLVGCNTMQGAGKDIERGGEKLQESAKDTKARM